MYVCVPVSDRFLKNLILRKSGVVEKRSKFSEEALILTYTYPWCLGSMTVIRMAIYSYRIWFERRMVHAT